MQLSIRQKIVARDDHVVFALAGEDQSGIERYCFLEVGIPRLEDCMRAMDRDGFTPASWGKVLADGIGRPTEYRIKQIQARFGVAK